MGKHLKNDSEVERVNHHHESLQNKNGGGLQKVTRQLAVVVAPLSTISPLASSHFLFI